MVAPSHRNKHLDTFFRYFNPNKHPDMLASRNSGLYRKNLATSTYSLQVSRWPAHRAVAHICHKTSDLTIISSAPMCWEREQIISNMESRLWDNLELALRYMGIQLNPCINISRAVLLSFFPAQGAEIRGITSSILRRAGIIYNRQSCR